MKNMLSHLSRTFYKRQGRIVIDSIVKVSKRDFEDKCDILYQYNPMEIETLKRKNHIEIEVSSNNDDNIEFSNDISNEDEIDISDI